MTTQEHAKARLRAYVAHFADHAQDHVAEINALLPAVAGDAALDGLLERALQDMQQARHSLGAVLEKLGSQPASKAGHHHSHPHVHHGLLGGADAN